MAPVFFCFFVFVLVWFVFFRIYKNKVENSPSFAFFSFVSRCTAVEPSFVLRIWSNCIASFHVWWSLYGVLPGFTGFYRVLPGFTGFLPSFSGFDWASSRRRRRKTVQAKKKKEIIPNLQKKNNWKSEKAMVGGGGALEGNNKKTRKKRKTKIQTWLESTRVG